MIGATTFHGLLGQGGDAGGVSKFGYLYNWWGARLSSFMPGDWAIPTEDQWDDLSASQGGDTVSGGKLKEPGIIFWNDPNVVGTPTSGFAAYGGGYRTAANPAFLGFRESATFSLSTFSGVSAFGYGFMARVNDNAGTANGLGAAAGCSVRGVYNGVGSPESTIVDYDGNTYDVILLGSYYWMVQNWACTKLSDGTPLTKVTDPLIWDNNVDGEYFYCAFDNDDSNVFV